MLTNFAVFRWLFVIARNSSFAYKGQPPDPPLGIAIAAGFVQSCCFDASDMATSPFVVGGCLVTLLYCLAFLSAPSAALSRSMNRLAILFTGPRRIKYGTSASSVAVKSSSSG